MNSTDFAQVDMYAWNLELEFEFEFVEVSEQR